MIDGSENAIFSWLLNFRIRMFVKSAVKPPSPYLRVWMTGALVIWRSGPPLYFTHVNSRVLAEPKLQLS